MRRDTAELLAAYCDGVGELTPSERKRVELYLADEGARGQDEITATRELIGKLRELPPRGEPDWIALERSIQERVGDEVPRPFWRRQKKGASGVAAPRRWFALPAVLALAGATAIAVIVLRGAPAEEAPAPIVQIPVPPDLERAPDDETVAVYLDGTDLELAIEASELADDKLDEMTFAGLDMVDATENLLGDDLAWIDELDDAELRRLEVWLEREKVKGT